MPKKSMLRPADFITTRSNMLGEDESTIDFSNRFFTLRKHATTDILPIQKELDPFDCLSNTRKHKYEYTEDNEIRIMEAKSKDNEWKFKKIKSSKIAVGNIVEVQVNFTLIPLGNNEYSLKAIFREVACFDNTLAMKAAVKAQEEEDDEALLWVKNIKLTNNEDGVWAGPSTAVN
ncbi:hypothetical protein BDN71DRAFT_1594062 [Pleurotus eryngii]|uniref:Uncharacterized protein n=1 Tax=Pleurotus eryngii TaxID=5323 RepID=A0A9P5ZIR1_PLEER|nr:hypothetical protein BDN71DRAFT_1594062 [Pleurotus eryngii]